MCVKSHGKKTIHQLLEMCQKLSGKKKEEKQPAAVGSLPYRRFPSSPCIFLFGVQTMCVKSHVNSKPPPAAG